ncbi:hypothetical protein N752_22195 [Desulforamulus aquiferis]|nr:hypothetical protein [Desulforamulus aquiferis]RYD02899.1 hypothetical protein N752_22195 [Desulforamulus aquiferis]
MRKFALVMCFLFLISLSIGCGAARKPEQTEPAPKTIVVPDVSKVSFETIELEKAPEIVRALANNLEESHYATWTAVNGRNYVVISQQNLPVGKGIEIIEIERRIPANDFDWINVRLRYLANVENGEQEGEPKPIVAVFSLDRAVKAWALKLGGRKTRRLQLQRSHLRLHLLQLRRQLKSRLRKRPKFKFTKTR